MPSEHHLRNQPLQGRCFKGQDLTNSDSSGADIRGADFSGANLTNANFRNAQAGLQNHWKWLLAIACSLLAGLSGYVTSLAAFWVGLQLIYDFPRLFTAFLFLLFVLIIFITISRYRELLSAIGFTPLIFTVLIFLAGGLTVVGQGYPTAAGAGAGVAAGAIAGATIVAICLAAVRIIAGYTAIVTGIGCTVLGSGVATWQSYTEEMALTEGVNPLASALSVCETNPLQIGAETARRHHGWDV
jgi:hypothetical protein